VSELRAVIVPPRPDLSQELGRLRQEAAERYTEVDLLVAAMREHIEDLRRERDALLAQLDRTRDELRRRESPWLARGQKPPHA
jgi:hypothetical protein